MGIPPKAERRVPPAAGLRQGLIPCPNPPPRGGEANDVKNPPLGSSELHLARAENQTLCGAQTLKIIGVMILAWLHARASGPFPVKRPDFSVVSAQLSVAKGIATTKMIAK